MSSLIVNGEPIDPSIIDQEFGQIKAHYESLAQVSCCERDDEFLGYAKDNIISRVLLAQEARRRDQKVLKADVDKELEAIKKQYRENDSSFGPDGISAGAEEMIRKDIAMRLRMDALIDEVCGQDPDPTEEEQRAYYEKHIEDFQTEEEVRALHIFKSLSKSENRSELYDEMRNIRRNAMEKDADFLALAREHSDKEPDEIDLGFFKQGEHMEEFETIAFSLEVGEVSPVFSTHWGFHLVKLAERKPRAPYPFEKIQDSIRELMIDEARKEKLDAFVAELRKTAKIEDKSEEEESEEEKEEGVHHSHS